MMGRPTRRSARGRAEAAASAVLLASLLAGCATSMPGATAHGTGGVPSASSASPDATAAQTIEAPGARDVPSTGGVKLLPTAPGKLDGRTVVLDPGHNGKFVYSVNNKMMPTWGSTRHACLAYGTASNDKKTTESALAFTLATKASDLLRAEGATVVLTRPDDSGTGPCNNERAEIANRNAASAFISLHLNGVDGAEAQQRIHGYHVNYSDVMMGGAEMVKRSKQFAEYFVSEMKRDSTIPMSNYEGTPGDPIAVRDRDLAQLNGVATGPAILTELGVIQNNGDYAILTSPAGQDAIAKALAATVEDMLADPSMATYTPKPTSSAAPVSGQTLLPAPAGGIQQRGASAPANSASPGAAPASEPGAGAGASDHHEAEETLTPTGTPTR